MVVEAMGFQDSGRRAACRGDEATTDVRPAERRDETTAGERSGERRTVGSRDDEEVLVETRRFRWWAGVAAIAWLAVGCDGDAEQAAPADEAEVAGAPASENHVHGESPMDGAMYDVQADSEPSKKPVVCTLGTMYPGLPAIDPDNPDFSDDVFSKEQVIADFAEDKAKNGAAYRAYKAALENQETLECAFCACGCAPSIGHTSAIDCFKDMHGFT